MARYSKVLGVFASLLFVPMLQAHGQEFVVIITASTGFYAPNAVDAESPGVLNPNANPSGQVMFQLIFTPSSFLEAPTATGALSSSDIAAGARLVGGNQSVSMPGMGGTIIVGGEYADGIVFNVPPEPFEAGNFFVRVFDRSPSAMGPGYYYYEFGPVAAASTTSMLPQRIEINRDLAFDGEGDELTISLLGSP